MALDGPSAEEALPASGARTSPGPPAAAMRRVAVLMPVTPQEPSSALFVGEGGWGVFSGTDKAPSV